MSMANSKRKAHCNKVPHKTLLGAQIALRKTLAKPGDKIITGLSVYKCPYCANFHVGRSQAKGINWEAIAAHDAKLRGLASSRIAGQEKKENAE